MSNALREIYARFVTQFDSRPLEAGDASVSALTDRLQNLTNVITGGALVVGLRAMVSEFVGMADEIGDTSAFLGMSTDALQEWRHAAALSGVEASQLDGVFVRLQDGMASNLPAFRQLGVSVRDATGELRPVGDVLADLADPIAALSTDAERTGMLVDILGRSGARLGPLFARGSEGLAEVRKELALLGGGVTPEAAEAAGALDDAMVRLNTAALGLKSRLAVFLLPALESLYLGAIRVSQAFTRMTDRGRFLETTLVVLGAAAAAAGAKTVIAWVRAAAPFIVLGALVLGLILIVEDLVVGLEGGRSALGTWGEGFQEWAEAAEGPMAVVAGGLLLVRDAIRFVTISWAQMLEAFARFAGFEIPDAFHDVAALNAGFGSVYQGEGARGPQGPTTQRRGAMADVRAMREQRAAAEAMGIGGLNRQVSAAVGGAGRSAPQVVAPQVNQTVRIDRVDTSGLTPEAASMMVTAAVSRAMEAQASDTLDLLVQSTTKAPA